MRTWGQLSVRWVWPLYFLRWQGMAISMGGKMAMNRKTVAISFATRFLSGAWSNGPTLPRLVGRIRVNAHVPEA